jgi:hypothetical protein
MMISSPNADGTMPGKETQTGINRSTNVPITRTYLRGLRGNPYLKKTVVNFTFEPE